MSNHSFGDLTMDDTVVALDANNTLTIVPLAVVEGAGMVFKHNPRWLYGLATAWLTAGLLAANGSEGGAIIGLILVGLAFGIAYAVLRKAAVSVFVGKRDLSTVVGGRDDTEARLFVSAVARAAADVRSLRSGAEP